MGALTLGLLYLATAFGLALLVRWAGGREALLPGAALLLALLPLAFTAPGFLPGKVLAPTNSLLQVPPWLDPELAGRVEAGSSRPNPLLFDPLTEMIPWQRAARDGLLFTPAQGGGAALLGNGQSAVLFPTEIAGRLLSPLRAATYGQAARLAVAAFGLFLLARSLGLSQLAALAGAAAFAGCGFLQLWRLHPHSLVAATAPWVLWAALALAREPGRRTAAALGLAGAGAVLAGHAETLAQVLPFAALLAAAALVRELVEAGPGRRLRRVAATLAAVSAAAVLAGLLAAPALLPFVENLTVSAEWQRRGEELPEGNEALLPEVAERLAPALTPWAFGDPLPEGPEAGARGPDNLLELGGGSLGAAALLLAALGLARRRASFEPGPWLWLVLGLVGLLVAAKTPWLSTPFAAAPLLGVSLLKRLTLWWALAGSLLAAGGVQRLTSGDEPRPALPALLAGVVVLAALLALAAWRLPGARAAAGAPLEAAALAAALAAGWALLRRPEPRWRAGALALLALALVAPRVLLFHDWVPRASGWSFYPETRTVREVRERLEAAPPGTRVAGLDSALLPHAAAFFGFEEVRAYDPMTFAPYERFLELLGERFVQGGVRIYDPALPGLAFLGVRFVFDHPSMTHRPGVEVVRLDRDAILYENSRALPRAFVPTEVEIAKGEDAAFGAVAAVADFARRAVVEARSDLPPPGHHPNGEAEVTTLTVEPGRVEATVEAESVALVATSQPAIPGWRLFRDGEEFEPLRVNGAFLGAAVGPGESRLLFVYDPWTWKLGKALAAVGLVLAVGMLWRRA